MEQEQIPLTEFKELISPLHLDQALSDLRDVMILDGVPDPFFFLILSSFRKPDLIDNCQNIKQLIPVYSLADIASASGLAPAFLKKCLTMERLDPELVQAYRQGKIKRTIIQQAAHLPAATQRRLIAILREKGKIKYQDLHEVKRDRAEKAASGLPAFMFDTPAAGNGAGQGEIWRQEAADQLLQAASGLPPDAGQIKKRILQLASEIATGITACNTLDLGEEY